MATRVGLGGSQWFDWEYDSTNDRIIISRNPEANGSITIRNQDVTIEGALASSTLAITSAISAASAAIAGACVATSFTVVSTAGYTGTCDAARTATFVGGLATTC